MIFYTRQLQDGIQEDSGWTRRASNEWRRRKKIYRRYFAAISPMLPVSVVRICEKGLHDAVVVSVSQDANSLTLLLDARGTFGIYRGRLVRLVFRGLRRHVSTRGWIGRWWLYEEPHLCSRTRFSLHVLFDHGETEIEADELSIRKV